MWSSLIELSASPRRHAFERAADTAAGIVYVDRIPSRDESHEIGNIIHVKGWPHRILARKWQKIGHRMTDDRGNSGDGWMVTVKGKRLSEIEAIPYITVSAEWQRQIRAEANFAALISRPEDLQIDFSETGLSEPHQAKVWKSRWGWINHPGTDLYAITAEALYHRVRCDPENEYVRVLMLTDADRRLFAEIADLDPDWIDDDDTAALVAGWFPANSMSPAAAANANAKPISDVLAARWATEALSAYA